MLNNGTYLDNEYYDVYRVDLSLKEVEMLSPQKSELESLHWFSIKEFQDLLEKEPSLFVEHPEDFKYLKRLG